MRWFMLTSVVLAACNAKQFDDQNGSDGTEVPSNDKDNDGVIDSEDCNDSKVSMDILGTQRIPRIPMILRIPRFLGQCF